MAYNFTGQVTEKKHIHTAPGKTEQVEHYTYVYDRAGRLTECRHKLNDNDEMPLAINGYDELGRLRYSSPKEEGFQETAYTYNVRSWLTELSTTEFLENLNYDYGGNITKMDWLRNAFQERSYSFSYDNLNRLKGAIYKQDGVQTDRYRTAYTYDMNGNIKTLTRYGDTDAATYGVVDQLTATYNGNQLKSIADAAPAVIYNPSADFKDYTTADTEYAYNANGAMTQDLNKGISSIQYNYLNLPLQTDIVSPVAEARNIYTYAADGGKLRVVQKWNPNYSTMPVIGTAVNTSSLTMTKTTDYCGNVIYENGQLKRILTENGYIENNTYYFYSKDHLGNVRWVGSENGEVVQYTDYYPFGLPFAGNTGQNVQPYKFGGKEYDPMHGLNMYDFHARGFDGMQFTTMDPLAEKYYSISPYAYCANNPINAIDPDGKDSYLLIWFSGNDETGHAGIAVDNYKQQQIMDSKGKPVLDSKGNPTYEMVKDGTMTYYDLWPNSPVGKTELQSNVQSDYSKGVVINSLSDLTTKDPTGSRSGNVSAEGRAADGIVQVNTTYEQDTKIQGYASKTANSGKDYNASSFNYSTFAENALKTAFPKLDASQYVKVPFPLNVMYNNTRVTAPNNLYNAAMKLPNATNIRGPKSVVARPYLEYYGK